MEAAKEKAPPQSPTGLAARMLPGGSNSFIRNTSSNWDSSSALQRNTIRLIQEPSVQAQSVIQMLDEQQGPIAVKLHRFYICGEEQSLLGQMDAAVVLELLRQHPEWMAVQENLEQSSCSSISMICQRPANVMHL